MLLRLLLLLLRILFLLLLLLLLLLLPPSLLPVIVPTSPPLFVYPLLRLEPPTPPDAPLFMYGAEAASAGTENRNTNVIWFAVCYIYISRCRSR